MSTRPTVPERIDALAARFAAHFGRRPEAVACAPGRVNLIGEHTDYNGLPVLPMAIDRSILVAGARRDDGRVRVASVQPEFAPGEYEVAASIPASPAGDWLNYHKAATQGLALLAGAASLRGGDFLVEGNIPPGAGLSSSSALVVGSALALLAVNERSEPAPALAELLAAAERYVGTHSGGMDQAVCLLAQAGHALRVDFDPLRVRQVPLLEGYAFVACHSLVVAEKSGPARALYNHRVAGCRLACRVLERALGTSVPRPLAHFGDLTRLFRDRALSEFVPVLENVLPPRPLRLAEIAAIIGSPVEALAAMVGIPGAADVTYALLQRARHVLTEAERVDRAEAALVAGDWLAFSALLDASHASCRDDYAVSCPEIEALIGAAKQAGALGARLTGAGFGGCTVNLLHAADLSLFCTMIERSYYRGIDPGRTQEHCFVLTPSAGATVVRP